jgi:hypothetical protein
MVFEEENETNKSGARAKEYEAREHRVIPCCGRLVNEKAMNNTSFYNPKNAHFSQR